MRVLSKIIEISARPVPDIGQNLSTRHTVAAQTIRDEAARLVLQLVQ